MEEEIKNIEKIKDKPEGKKAENNEKTININLIKGTKSIEGRDD